MDRLLSGTRCSKPAPGGWPVYGGLGQGAARAPTRVVIHGCFNEMIEETTCLPIAATVAVIFFGNRGVPDILAILRHVWGGAGLRC